MKTFNSSKKKLWLPVVFGASLVCIIQSAHSGGMGSGATEEGQAIKKSPPFREVDKDGDHYVTKDELADYPDLLRHFDMVDAGKTGKLNEHEYGSLVLEKAQSRGR
jgi:hypothetical protein